MEKSRFDIISDLFKLSNVISGSLKLAESLADKSSGSDETDCKDICRNTTTELISTFHVHINRIGQLRALAADSAPGRAGVEPNVHDVGIFLPIGSAALADFALGHDLVGIVLIPGVAALLAEQVGDSLDGSIGDVVLATLLAVEDRDGHAPDALTADAPVAAVTDHASHTVMAPGRYRLKR